MKQNKHFYNKFSKAHILVAAVVVGAVGVGAWKQLQPSKQQQPTQLASIKALPNDLSQVKALNDILALAATDIGTQSVKQVELQQTDQGPAYVLRLNNGQTLAYDAVTGTKTTLSDTESSEVGTETLPAGYHPDVPLLVALKTGKDAFPGSEVARIKLELKNGVAVYSIRFTDGSIVSIDAKTGAMETTKQPAVNSEDNDTKVEDNDTQSTELKGDDSHETESLETKSGSDDSGSNKSKSDDSNKTTDSRSND